MYTKPNYTLGAGKTYIAYSEDPAFGDRYLGNSPGLEYNPAVTTLPFWESQDGVNVQTDTVIVELGGSCKLTLDDITDENLGLYMMRSGDPERISAEKYEKTFRLVPGNAYDLGVSAVRSFTAWYLGAQIPLTNFEVDGPVGLVVVKNSADIYFGQEVTFKFIGDGITRSAEYSAALVPYRGRLRYVENNIAGESRVLMFPSVVIYPDDGLDLKSSDWRKLVFNVEVLELPYWMSRKLRDDYDVAGPMTEDFGNLSQAAPVFTDDYGVENGL